VRTSAAPTDAASKPSDHSALPFWSTSLIGSRGCCAANTTPLPAVIAAASASVRNEREKIWVALVIRGVPIRSKAPMTRANTCAAAKQLRRGQIGRESRKIDVEDPQPAKQEMPAYCGRFTASGKAKARH